MSRREIGFRERDSHRDSRHDSGRNVRYPLHPLPSHRERLKGDSFHSHRTRSISPLRSHRDRLRGDSRGRNGHREPSPRHRISRSPVRGLRHRADGDFHSLRVRSPDGYRRRSVDPHPRRDSSREGRMRSPRRAVRSPPPPPPPRSPHLHMRPVSPRYPMRRLSPQVPPRLASPRASMRPLSPRLAMRPISPQASLRPLSPQVSLHPARLPLSRSPPLTSVFDRDIDRHVHDSILGGSRNGPLLALPRAPSLGAGSTDVTKQEDESLSSSGMLVPRSIFLEDGTVGTFYSLPPNPLLNPIAATVDTALGSKLLPPFSDGLTQFTMETASMKYSASDKYMAAEHNYLAQDQRISDRAMPSLNRYVTGDKSLPEFTSYKRDRPHSPLQNAFERLSQRKASVSPLHGRDGVVNSSSREVYPLDMERAPRRINYDQKESAFSTVASSRDGFSSPHKRRSEEEYRKGNNKDMVGYGRDLKHGEFLRLSEEGRASHRYAPSGFDPSRQKGLVQSPEPSDRLRFESRDCSLLKRTRTPPRGPSRHDDGYLHHYSGYRPDIRGLPSPGRNARMSPRRMRSLTPPTARKNFSYEEERRAWKRKFIEMGGDPFREPRIPRPYEPEFKRRERDGDMRHNNHPRDRRPSGWDRQDGWPERREDAFDHHVHRLPRERSRSPQLSRRFLDSDRSQNERKVTEQPAKMNGVQTIASLPEMQELAADLPEDSPEFKQQVQRALLKYAKIVNEDSEQRKKYKEQGKAGTLLCVACGRLSKPFVDTQSLVMHTVQSKKKGLHAEHLGLCKAICSFMGWGYDVDPAGGKAYQNISVEEAKANKEDLILWPPAVIIHNVVTSKITTETQREAAAESAIKQLLQDTGLPFERIKIAAGRQGTVIIKYSPVLSCLHDAEHLHKHFVSSGFGRGDWVRVEAAKQESDTDDTPVAGKSEKTGLLYGYLALADDLDKVDTDLHRRCQIKSRKDIEAIAGDPLADKKASS